MLAHCTETVSGKTRGGRNKRVSITCRECGRTKFMAPIKMEVMPKTRAATERILGMWASLAKWLITSTVRAKPMSLADIRAPT